MPLRSLLSLVAGAVLLTACATAPVPYGPAPDRETPGYSEIRIEQNRYRVTVRGRSAADRDVTEAYARRRAAELTLAAGFSSFQIVRNETYQSEARTMGAVEVFPTPFAYDPFVSQIRRRDLERPMGPAQTVLEIVLFRSPASTAPGRLDAEEILREISASTP